MKKIITLTLMTFLLTPLLAQENGVCGFDEHNERLLNLNPGAEQEIHQAIMRAKSAASSMNDRAVIGIVPVVVHVIHDGGPSNITYDQILSGIQVLNEDYQKMNADTGSVRNTADAPFEAVAADSEIQFELAKIDPNGQCTNGVQRRYNPEAGVNADDGVKFYSSGGLDAWPRDSYLNIWVVTSIDGSGGGTTLGYAQFPYFGAANTYGVVIRHDRMGNTGTATSNDRTLTHELGHCFGLLHTFQDGCSTSDCSAGGDYCCDTPPVSEAQWSCSTSQNTCTGIPTNDHYGFDAYDQFENYMSYSPCQYMFSEDQRDIMQGNFTGIGFMQDLISPANATATGVGSPAQLCKAEFSSTRTVICQGQTVDYSDESYFNVTDRTWTFDGGTPATSNDPNPVVTYNTPGVYSVTLEATDGTGVVSTIETDYVTVLAGPGESIPYIESFEEYTSLPDNENWLIENEDGGQTFVIQSGFGASGDQCIKLANFGLTNQSKDHLVSGTIDLSGVDPADDIIFTFKYAYRKRLTANDEWLRFFISGDCGQSWTLRKNIHGDDLSDQTQTTAFTPTEDDWVEVEITNINSAFYIDNFRFKLEFENDNGNNIYLDDINISSGAMASLIEDPIADNLSVYPNPVNNQMEIKMDVYDTADYTITLTNALGQQLAIVYQGEIVSGQTKIIYDTSELPAGMYFLNIEANGSMETTKVIKQ
ncbi:MAG: M43 family zinc metalloprotease [Crocinitomicaceae bacterium]